MTQRLVHEFLFTEAQRSGLVFSNATKIRLNSLTNQIELKPTGKEARTGRNLYPTEANLYVKTAPFTPRSVKRWFGFSAVPRPTLQPDQTSVGYRLNNGSNDYYWDSADWVVAGSSNWNTEQVVVANIDTFPATSKQIAVVVNLKTDDQYVTPAISSIDLGFEAEIDYIRSVLSALIESLRDNLRYDLRLAVAGNGTTTVTLPTYDTAYDIVGVDAVYNMTDDAGMHTNIASSFNPSTRVLTLTTNPSSAKTLLVRLIGRPSVQLSNPSQDWREVMAFPSVTLDNLTTVGAQVWGEQLVKNIAAGTASYRYMPIRLHLRMDLLVESESNDTELHLWEGLWAYFRQTPLLDWKDLDKQISMRVVMDGAYNQSSNLRDSYRTTMTCILENIYLWLDAEQSKPLVLTVNTTLDRR